MLRRGRRPIFSATGGMGASILPPPPEVKAAALRRHVAYDGYNTNHVPLMINSGCYDQGSALTVWLAKRSRFSSTERH